MIKIWGRPNSSNTQKVLWCLGEIGLAFERVPAGMELGVVDTPEYRRLNPNGLVPTIDDGGLVLWESNTIVRYLARKYDAGGLSPEDAGARALAERWMDWQMLTINPPANSIFWALIRLPAADRDADAIERARIKSIDLWAIADAQLRDGDYLCGDRLTIGDIALGVTANRWFMLDIERPPMAGLDAWYARLAERAAFREHVMLPLS